MGTYSLRQVILGIVPDYIHIVVSKLKIVKHPYRQILRSIVPSNQKNLLMRFTTGVTIEKINGTLNVGDTAELTATFNAEMIGKEEPISVEWYYNTEKIYIYNP